MTGYVVRDGRESSYLEWTPADRAFSWLAGSLDYATVLTLPAAKALARLFAKDGATVRQDREGRMPEFDLEDLDPDLFCLTHGKPLPMGPYGVRYGGCDDCEPAEPDGEDFRGGEAAACERESQAAIQRDLK